MVKDDTRLAMSLERVTPEKTGASCTPYFLSRRLGNHGNLLKPVLDVLRWLQSSNTTNDSKQFSGVFILPIRYSNVEVLAV